VAFHAYIPHFVAFIQLLRNKIKYELRPLRRGLRIRAIKMRLRLRRMPIIDIFATMFNFISCMKGYLMKSNSHFRSSSAAGAAVKGYIPQDPAHGSESF
jgi:hypothetical protein